MKRYRLTDEQLTRLKEASRPTPAIALHCGAPSSPQANVNSMWRELGEEMGFRYMTVRGVPGQPENVFEAQPADRGQ